MANTYELGPFRLETHTHLLLHGSQPVALGGRAVALLQALVERPGALVSRDALIEAAWSGQAVEDSNLGVQIAALRRALGKAPGGASWIETMPRRGYRFVGPVVVGQENLVTAAPSQVDVAPHWHREAERRQVTALSCELVFVGAGLEDFGEAVREFRRCVSETAARRAGATHRRLGNNVLVLFGYPEAHDYDAEQAVHVGLELCAAVKHLRPDTAIPMGCRIGIATGMVIIGDSVEGDAVRDPEIVGIVPNLAARLQESAQLDTVAIDVATQRLIGNLFDCRALRAVKTAGGIEPTQAWQVLGESIVASRFEALHSAPLSQLVGRDEEIELLLRRWARAEAKEGQIVLVSGEPGIGKSRIIAALEERLHGEPHQRLRCFCSPYHQNSALFPVVDQLARASGFARDDPTATRFEKLKALLARADSLDEDMALLADLMSLPASEPHLLPKLSPQRKKERTLEALMRQVDGLARRQPIVVVFEDVQWIDPTSRELLDLMVEWAPSLSALLIVTFRPEFQPPWAGQPQVTMLALNRLDQRARTTLIAQIADSKPMPDEVVSQIAERTDGVPLFIEELTKSVLETGLLREENDRYVIDRALPPLAIPVTLHASLLARLDRLGSVRRVAQIGAAIGRQFPYALLHTVCRLPEDELQTALGRLVASELVFQRGTPPDAIYTFKHALVQDAAYGSLLRNTRQQLHALIAEALETDTPDLLESQPELLAQHYTEAGLVEKSVACWSKAGHRSAARSAIAEAVVQLQKGLDQLALLPDDLERQRRELEFRSALGGVLQAAKGYAAPETGHAHARARELWEQLGCPSEFLQVPLGQSVYHSLRGDLDLAQRLADDLLRLSQERNDFSGLVLGHASSGRNLMYVGRFASSRSHLEKALALCDAISHRLLGKEFGSDACVNSQAYLGFVLFCLGYPDQALAQVDAAIAEARRLDLRPSLALTLTFGARLHSLSGENASLDERATQLVEVATEQGFPFWRAMGAIYRGWVKVKNGDVTEGICLLRSGSTAYRATGAELYMPHFGALHAGACEIAGQIEEAATLVDMALEIVERTGERWFAAELYRHKGRLLLRQGHAQAAEELYCKALKIAREQEAKLWELRAAVGLARLWGEQGRRAEARALLAPVYGWFAEGSATPDLKEAMAELENLA